MNLGNISQLRVPSTPPLQQRSHKQGEERDAEFLSLRLLNKRARVRLSPAVIDCGRLPGKTSLLTVGNQRGYFAAAVRKEDGSDHVLVSTLCDLRAAIKSGQAESESFVPFTPQRPLLSVPGTPNILKFAFNDKFLLVALLEGHILVYSVDDLVAPMRGSHLEPTHCFPGDNSSIPRDILPNPGENSELVAIMRRVHGKEMGCQIDVVDIHQFKHVAGWRKGDSPNVAPVSISWSPKGKQIAIGMESGDMLLYSLLSPESPKSHLLKPPSIFPANSSLLATTWLTNPTFHTVYSSPEASSSDFDISTSASLAKIHFISTHESKTHSAVDIELLDPSPPFGAQFPPGPFSVVLRDWSPTKFIIICGDGPSSDIGVIGSLSPASEGTEDMWVNFTLEETSTPSLPLGEDTQDMVLLGLELDLTNPKSVRISEQPDDGIPDLPPSPILYAYMNDGTVVAWHVLNTNGNAYPGMIATAKTAEDSPRIHSVTQQTGSAQAFGMSSPSTLPPVPPTAGSPFRATEASSPSTHSAPVFGQTSSPASPNTTPSSIAPAAGFGAFGSADTTHSQFGSSGFGFGAGSAPSTFAKPTTTSAFGSSAFGSGGASEADTQKPIVSLPFGTTSFGQVSPTFGAPGFSSQSVAPTFGQRGFGVTPSGPPQPTFGSSHGGFAAFASQGASAFGAPVNISPSESKHAQSLPLGQDAFARTASPSVSQSAFGAGGLGQTSTPSSTGFGAGRSGVVANPSSTMSVEQGQRQQESQPATNLRTFGKKAVTPTFGQAGFESTKDSTGSQSGSFGNFGTLGDALKPSTPTTPANMGSPPGSPTSPNESPPSSPDLRPSTLSTKPASSYVKPATGFGTYSKPSAAFKAPSEASRSISSSIKTAEGFGSSSYQKPQLASTFGQQKSPAPTFGSTSFGSSVTSAGTASPTFGSTSALGSSKPVFGTSAFGAMPQAITSEPSKPIIGGFGAFSSGGGGFASFANANKSATFGDILSLSGLEQPKSSETPFGFGSPSTPKASNMSASDAPIEHKKSPILLPGGKPTNVTLAPDVGFQKADADGDQAGKKLLTEDTLANQEPPVQSSSDQDTSFSLLSLNEVTSLVEPRAMAHTPAGSPVKLENMEPSDQGGDESNDPEDVDETPSESFSLTDDGFGESVSDRRSSSLTRSLSEESLDDPASVPLPETPNSQTPSSTPTPTPLPSARETGLPAANTDLSALAPLEPSHPRAADKPEASTTPPGSPAKPRTPTESSVPAPLAPKPVIPQSTVSPFGLGLGRPSSRPIRSSPLASAPITSVDGEDAPPDITPSVPSIVNTRSGDPKASSEQSSLPVPITTTAPSVDYRDNASPAARRPKTPPLLGTSSTSGPKSLPLKNAFVLGQSQVSPMPLKASSSPVLSPVATPLTNPCTSPAQEAEEEEFPKHPMQIEFQRAYEEMTKELVQLRRKAQEMSLIRPIISEPRGLHKLLMNNQDFVPGKYSLGDLTSFTTMIGTLQKKLVPLLEQGNANKGHLQDLQNLALISETKQEELSRWVRAREDSEFAKTLKPRTLGPEHSENQTHLRKAVQIARDRIQHCEDEMEALKKRLEQHRSGKVGLRPPSLDTIDRTCRNIQLALEERTKLLEQLSDRLGDLSPQAAQRLQSSQGYPSTSSLSPSFVTPPFASVAAAALNTERSSLRLKNALLSARKVPLFTTRVTRLEITRTAVQSAQVSPQAQRPDWKLPLVPPLNTPSASGSRRTARTGKRHGAVPLKAGTPGGDAKPVAFDWGPLPGVAPMEKLSLDVRTQKQKGFAHVDKQEACYDEEWEEAADEQHH